MLMQGDGPARWLRGWALAHLGSPREGFKLIREGYESHARLGMYAGNVETLCHAAEALILDEDWNGAERQLDQAIELVQRFGERAELPRLFLLSSRAAQGRGDDHTAGSLRREALAEATASGSRHFELAALTALCEQPSATKENFDALAQTLRALPEGHSTPPAMRAQSLLRH